MKIILAGGVNPRLNPGDETYSNYGYGNYVLVQHQSMISDLLVAGGKIAFCNAAKPDMGMRGKRLREIGFNPDDFIVLERSDRPDWDEYDAVFMPGGETRELHAWLKRHDFSLDRLKRCQWVSGESAGAYVLASKTLIDYDAKGAGVFVEVIDGFVPELNYLVAAHVNNDYYHSPELSAKLKTWCAENSVEYLPLKENEIREFEI